MHEIMSKGLCRKICILPPSRGICRVWFVFEKVLFEHRFRIIYDNLHPHLCNTNYTRYIYKTYTSRTALIYEVGAGVSNVEPTSNPFPTLSLLKPRQTRAVRRRAGYLRRSDQQNSCNPLQSTATPQETNNNIRFW